MIDATPRWLGALPAVVLVTVVVAGFLLVFGYGVPVGIGVLVGLVIGTLSGLLVGAIVWSRRSRSGFTSFESGSSQWISHADAPFSAPPDELMRAVDLGSTVDSSDLVRVVAGGDRASSGGLELTIIAIELRAAGGLAHVMLDGDRHTMLLAPLAEATVEDDVGTPYVAGGMSGGGSGERMRYEVRFSPPPPRDATELRITITRFWGPGFGNVPTGGPWTVRVPL